MLPNVARYQLRHTPVSVRAPYYSRFFACCQGQGGKNPLRAWEILFSWRGLLLVGRVEEIPLRAWEIPFRGGRLFLEWGRVEKSPRAWEILFP